MKEKICDSCGAEFEVEAGDSSPICVTCTIELQRETKEERQAKRILEAD
jgi:hypothetical protein